MTRNYEWGLVGIVYMYQNQLHSLHINRARTSRMYLISVAAGKISFSIEMPLKRESLNYNTDEV